MHSVILSSLFAHRAWNSVTHKILTYNIQSQTVHIQANIKYMYAKNMYTVFICPHVSTIQVHARTSKH